MKENISRKRRMDQEMVTLHKSGNLSLSSSSGTSVDSANAKDAYQDENSSDLPKKRARLNILDVDLTAALDRTKISDRNATFVVAATAQSLGQDINKLSVSRSSIRRFRNKSREEFNKFLKIQFKPKVSLVVHWDGKLLNDLTGKEQVDRLPVIVSGVGTNQLLGVPKLISGTGLNQASSILHLLEEWDITDRVKAFCFDTTASNTGEMNGTCAILEKILDRNFLNLACRHHIFEIVLGCVFKDIFGCSSGPDVALFKRFKQSWSNINKLIYISALNDECSKAAIELVKDNIIDFATTQLQNNHPRDDYKELLVLSIIFLGGIPPKGVRFMFPGPVHHARWMSKAIYALKIFIFSRQFKLTPREMRGIREVCIFVVRIYLKAWFTAPQAVSAPRNDLTFFQDLFNYRNTNLAISKVTCDKFSKHLWYLNEKLIALAFFDTNVSTETKRNMIISLKEKEGQIKNSKRFQLGNIENLENILIEDLVTKNTANFFTCLEIPCDFLDSDPELWKFRDDYKNALNIVDNLQVINDNAERGVALIEEYNDIITRNEEQKQFLLQVVQDHRLRFPSSSKEKIISNNRVV